MTEIKFNGRTWAWPAGDEKLHLVNAWVDDLARAIRWCAVRGLAVQAGGAAGIWPAYLAARFDKVLTFEPHPDNYRCLVANCEPLGNVRAYQSALSDQREHLVMRRPATEHGNAGAWYATNQPPATANERISAMPIDALKLPRCDLIQLDIEGREAQALRGATLTITEYLPVIMVENKPLPQCAPSAQHAAVAELARLNYVQREQVHNDLIFTHVSHASPEAPF